jgi:hypothetical protein
MSGSSSVDLIRAALVAAVLAPTLAFGQAGQPLRLGPAGPPGGSPPPSVPSPSVPSPSTPATTIPAPAPSAVAPIPSAGGTLPARPPEPAPPGAWGGTLDRIAGGFGRDMWAGTTSEAAAVLLAGLPVRTTSPAVRDLVVRLLLSRADGPSGGDPDAVERLRTDRLALLGIGGPPSPAAATPAIATAAGVAAATPGQLAAIAGDPAAAAPIRVAAAERGARAGVVTAESLLAAYSLLPLPPIARDEPLAAAAVDPENARAILALGLAGEMPASRRLALADAYVATLPAVALGGPMAHLATERLDDARPADAGIETAARIARALYGVGERARPVVWHRAALAGAGDETARRDARRLAPLSLAAAAIEPPGDLADWVRAETAVGDGRVRVAAVLSVLAALGVPVPAFDAQSLHDEPGRAPEPPTAAWAALESAVAGGRVAETAAAAAVLLGPDGPETASAPAAAAAIRGLFAVGLTDEARAIAREAVLARFD